MHSLSSIPRNLFLCLDNNPRLDLRTFQLSVVYQKPKQEELSIRIKETIAKRSQWVLEAKTSKLPDERENASHHRLVLVLHLIGWKNGASELDQSQSDRSRLLCKFINKRFLNTMKENAEERITIDEMLLSGNYVRRWAYPIFERRSWIFR